MLKGLCPIPSDCKTPLLYNKELEEDLCTSPVLGLSKDLSSMVVQAYEVGALCKALCRQVKRSVLSREPKDAAMLPIYRFKFGVRHEVITE